ncbi:MAG TPA: CPBP family intramembrane glutamic endopeptidase [Terracidiphilus sp.]
MNLAGDLRPGATVAAILLVAPMLTAAFCPGMVDRLAHVLPRTVRVIAPSVLCVPYALAAKAYGSFEWQWLIVYAVLPVGIAFLLEQARSDDAGRRGNWRDYVVLLVLGLAVDLRWLEPAWPRGWAALGKVLLLDAGIFGFLVVRRLEGVGFDLLYTKKDVLRGLGEFLLYALIAVPLGLWLGFLHWHAILPSPLRVLTAFVFTFLFIAIPEELFFRGWLQNLMERRMGRMAALLTTAIIFGVAHWNKRAVHFNWRYVLMAAIAGIFYGRAWQAQRRVGASALTHACVDTTWSIWLR